MSRNLPPLNALRAFEAAGRLLSFSKAALELQVTQAAVSRQIKELEKRLRAPLFVRLTRRIELTQVGQTYLREVQSALDHIELATRQARASPSRRILTISVLPSIASFWLMPRLAGFTTAHPHIETRILTSIQPVNLAAGEADLAIRVGALPGSQYSSSQPRIELQMVTDWRGVHADYLFPDVLVPVCSPGLVADDRPLSHPADVLRYPLIHTATRPRAWPDWLRAQGLTPPASGNLSGYGHFFMSIQAAREKLGIAIAPHILFGGSESNGLHFPFSTPVPSAGSYYLLTLESKSEDSGIALLRSWLLDQAKAQDLRDAYPTPTADRKSRTASLKD
jgi:LysR family glycine cleavage system transcriptional activator